MFVKSNIPNSNSQEDALDLTLRPKKWDSYVGQERIKNNLKVIIEAAKQRSESPDHLLFYGPAGLGKTTLAHIVAQEFGANLKVTSGPIIEKSGDLVALLTNLNPGDFLFIDECHRLNRFVEEYLYSAMEDFQLSLMLGRGPMAKTINITIPPFTLIGATTRLDLISAPLRSRFGAILQLNFYELEEIEKIIERSAQILNAPIEPAAIKIIAERSRFTPRTANKLLKRVRDFAQIEKSAIITKEVAEKALNFLEIDNLGLEPSDKKILEIIITRFNGGPVGLQALAAASSEEKNTILEIYEPYLTQLGLIKRTPQGRVATPLAYKHLNIKCPNRPKSLF
ncbi:MAG TPA: Holliday junction branch migration DNA helicase RuvB [Candidatus Pacearchaeota archaeon]|jgi:Holliday junction DNA helicase RuvB|nr:Holliday junction branch migration DNA helicase RuvB [Candidatus Pacearchaeota archaeon]HRR94841.1 Holliday junction branch migration DNA helicase RuvB [Candidatus Paceibacterota bacterium]HPC30610.1 Holliday junction branch migration DNA helicase RuvB [Candidatus Pacearchaeota archaeon]HQG09354.1 Holliday junction branch migration DNA helicase RuvB [Candidatus Pacearchaeota archaeon]HQH20223.1 Holliday junction branch migration DNA helicase RuvB [Candidatus Pacearchaeota archaeon]